MARSCRNFYGFLWRGRPSPRRQVEDRVLAYTQLNHAVELLESLDEEFPDTPQYRYELAQTLAARQRTANPKSALEITADLQRALRITGDLRKDYPSVPSYTELHAQILARQSRLSGGVGEIEQVIALFEDLVAEWPGTWSYLRQLALTRRPYAQLLIEEGDLVTSRRQLQLSIQEFTAFLENTTGLRREYRHLVNLYVRLEAVLEQTGASDELAQVRARRQAVLERMR